MCRILENSCWLCLRRILCCMLGRDALKSQKISNFWDSPWLTNLCVPRIAASSAAAEVLRYQVLSLISWDFAGFDDCNLKAVERHRTMCANMFAYVHVAKMFIGCLLKSLKPHRSYIIEVIYDTGLVRVLIETQNNACWRKRNSSAGQIKRARLWGIDQYDMLIE